MHGARVSVFLLFVVFMSAAGIASADLCSEPVDTEYGTIVGMDDDDTGTCAWLGIPYAAPPVGYLRWKAPQPVPEWDGVRKADSLGDRCVQAGGIMSGSGPQGVGMSEDCLNLNIWKPAKSGVFPVMFWIHGGGYYTGGGNYPAYWGDRLAEAGDVIVVTINYRLDIFGFMAHPKLREEDPNNSTGSYGTMDQAYALRWVKENIENFGGDPDNITVFGQSAGGASVCSMIATPLARGNFNKAIMHSGLCELSRDLDFAYQVTEDAVKKLDCDYNDLDCLRGLPAEKIIKKASSSMMDGFVYGPAHDGYVLTDTPLAMIEAGNYNRVDFMAGTVMDEFAKALKLKPKYYYTCPRSYEKRLQKSFDMTGDEAEELAELYPLDDFKGRPVEAMGRMFGADATMQCPTHRGLLAIADDGNKSWFYRFEYDSMKKGKYVGSFHTAEVPFVFDAFDRDPGPMFYKGMDLDKEEELSRIMQEYWTNFAKTGDPNGEGLPEWESFDPADQYIQILDTGKIATEPVGIVEERCQFWDEYREEFLPYANELIGKLF